MMNSILIDSSPLDEDLSEKLKQYISDILCSKGIKESALNIVFVSETAIHEMNMQYRHKDKPTDVITFSMLEGEDTQFSGAMLGDIYICPDCIDEEGIRPVIRRVLHGLLHILGYMHETDEENRTFIQIENEMLDDFFGGIDD